MSAVSQYKVSVDRVGQRLDNCLLNYLKGVPKSRLYKAIRRGEVRVNSGRVKPTYRLALGDTIRIPPLAISEKKGVLPPSDRWVKAFQRRIIYQNDQFMVFNKPSGMPVHAGTGVDRGLIENLKASPCFASDGWELAHRIDRETSGLLLLAKRGEALTQAHEMFRSKSMKKGYFLYVLGRWGHGNCTVDKPLLRYLTDSGERRVKVSPDGQDAVTHFSVVSINERWSLIWAEPESGRTHQIRVHAASLGYPIIGDRKYANSKQLAEGTLVSDRLCLHAASLRFPAPWAHLSVSALPDDSWPLMFSDAC